MIPVVHTTPPTESTEPVHLLDDWGRCWCHPVNEVVDGRLLIRHRRATETEGSK